MNKYIINIMYEMYRNGDDMSFTISLAMVLVICLFIFLFDKLTPIFSKYLLTKFHFPPAIESLLIFVISFFIIFIFNKHTFIVYNNYSYLSDALLHGRLDVPNMPLHLEQVSFAGKTYMHFAPGPSIILLPFIAIFGLGFNINIISIILGALNITFFYNILKLLGIDSLSSRLWITGLFGFGTVHFFLAALGHSWYLGSICAVFFVYAALFLLLKSGGKYLYLGIFFSGFLFAFAVTCRMAFLLSFPLFLYIMIKQKKLWIKEILIFCGGAFIPGGLYMLYNFVRYGTIMDMGYVLTFKKDYPTQSGGPLQLKFLPYNLYSIFLMAPEWKGEFPYIIPSFAGVSLTLTSPALFYAIKAKTDQLFKIVLWVTVVLTAIPFLLNYGNGMAQFSMRYAMDFIPYLMLLVAFALKKPTPLNKIVILLCIFINTWGVLYWNNFIVS